MKKYVDIYRLFMHLNFAKLTAYRGNFITNCFTSLAWAAFSVLSILLLTSRNPNTFGWTRQELLLLTGVYSIFIGLFHVLFTRNLDQIAKIAHRGQLDGYLLKPLDVQFYLSCGFVNYSSVPRVIAALFFVAWIVITGHMSVSPLIVLQFFVYGLVGLIFIYSTWFSILSITIRYSQLLNLSDLLYHTSDAAKYPTEMFQEARYFFTIFLLPLTLIISLPTKVLLHRATVGEAIVLIVLAILMFAFSRSVGKYVLRFYTSSSS